MTKQVIPPILQKTNSLQVLYPQAIDFTNKQLSIFWLPDEIKVEKDIQDILINMTPAEKHGVIVTLKLFTLYELKAGSEYWGGRFKDKFTRTELQRMASVFAMFELAIHKPFYSKINELLHLDTDEFYFSYEEDPILKDRMKFIDEMIDSDDDLVSLAGFSMIEGAILYSAFAFLKHFQSQGKNKLLNIVRGINFSVRDECLAEGTEVLTPNGWVDLKDISTTSKVAQYNIETQDVSFVNPSRVVSNYIEEDLIHFSGEKLAIEQLVTKKHRMIRKHEYASNFHFIEADKVKYNPKNFLPLSGNKVGGNNVLSDVERFFILTQADGHVSERYNGSICGTIPIKFSFSKQRKIDRFLLLVARLGFKNEELDKCAAYDNFNEKRNFKVHVPINIGDIAKIKTFDWINLDDVSGEWCTDFIEELSHWDGHIPKDIPSNGNYIYYSSIHKYNTDKVQAIASLCGKFATYSLQEDNRSDNFSDMHRLFIHDMDQKRGGSISKNYIQYKGYVRCVTVPTGAFIIRYNNRVSVTGNCLHSDAGAWAFRTLKAESNLSEEKELELKQKVIAGARKLYEHECHVIELTCEKGAPDGITVIQLKHFVMSRLNHCLSSLGYEILEEVPYNPIGTWFYEAINGFTFNDTFSGVGNSYHRNWTETDFVWETYNQEKEKIND